MSDNDPDANSPRHKPEHLLDELESIKGLLGEDDTPPPSLDIPLLDDMVIEHLDDNAQLLNLDRIFEEDTDNEQISASPRERFQFPRFQLDVAVSDTESIPQFAVATPSSKPSSRPNYRRDILIQELIDEFVPQIETALRERLAKLDTAALTQLKTDPAKK